MKPTVKLVSHISGHYLVQNLGSIFWYAKKFWTMGGSGQVEHVPNYSSYLTDTAPYSLSLSKLSIAIDTDKCQSLQSECW